MKRLAWFRIGAWFAFTDEEWEEVKAETKKGGEILRRKALAGDFELDGDTYAPATDYYDCEEAAPGERHEEINYDFDDYWRNHG